jgi:alpha/beta superfamily hydrolase
MRLGRVDGSEPSGGKPSRRQRVPDWENPGTPATLAAWYPPGHSVTAFRPPAPESIVIPGPVGPLEAVLEVPEAAAVRAVGVICHPHPLHGGTMHNKVVHMLARTFREQGVPTIRFNYRGVGASAGQYDDGKGETDDAVAALDFMAARWPDAALWLGGFSFGGAVAFRAAIRRPVARLVMAAPAVQRVETDFSRIPECPWLIVQGDQDDVIPPARVVDWVDALPRKPRFVMLEGVGHFFHGRLDDLRSTVRTWLEST